MPHPAPLDMLTAAIGPSTLGVMPPQGSTFAEWTDLTMAVINAITLFFFLGIIAVMVIFAWKYRRHADREHAPHTSSHNTALELGWTLPPLFIVLGLFYMGFVGFWNIMSTPADAYEIQVEAQKWSWRFIYPNGVVRDGILEVPSDRPVKLTMTSNDVLHSFYIPEFRVKKDVVPGRYSQVWFEVRSEPTHFVTPKADDPLPEGEAMTAMARAELRSAVSRELVADGKAPDAAAIDAEVEARWAKLTPELITGLAQSAQLAVAAAEGLTLFCTEFCGTQHSDMLAKVIVHGPGWTGPIQIAQAPEVRGQKLFAAKCTSCHYSKPTGGKAVGPSFAEGLFGKPRQTSAGAVVADENYILESIANPMAKIVTGFQPQMPKIEMNQRDMNALVMYLKSLGGAEGGDGSSPAPAPAGDSKPDQPETSAPAASGGAESSEIRK